MSDENTTINITINNDGAECNIFVSDDSHILSIMKMFSILQTNLLSESSQEFGDTIIEFEYDNSDTNIEVL